MNDIMLVNNGDFVEVEYL